MIFEYRDQSVCYLWVGIKAKSVFLMIFIKSNYENKSIYLNHFYCWYSM